VSNPVLILARNNLALTQRCVLSVLNQDIPTNVMVIDNGSSDLTKEWLESNPSLHWARFNPQLGVSKGWNFGLAKAFSGGAEYCLCPGNDTYLPPWSYRELLSYDQPFVTGVAVEDMKQVEEPPLRMALVPHPDFSCFLIRKSAWEAIGPFDEQMKLYSSDQDYHVRGHRRGVGMWKANMPFFHERSSTLRLASPAERAQIDAQANADRAVLKEKWGVPAGGPEYEALFSPEKFGSHSNAGSRTSSQVLVPAQPDKVSEIHKG